ncbi:hypothetical protein [Sandaracinobacteroides saxicola]|uniref:Uncharacterized protein n=1 Tax=Sandaracinobacteroides saxicola TaxID=2759707 RepID=A0A7G5ILD3_9SPHN|nr:hypothetical protein [Sandaracinobacteroides saxicola]QMW24175.1 hypothetical protein H3309_06895 [Sandaracinobacteroides saxicola]
MSNQRSLDMLHQNAGNWLLSRHLFIYSAPPAVANTRAVDFGGRGGAIANPGAANRADRAGYIQTQGHPAGRAARIMAPGAMAFMAVDAVQEVMGYIPMKRATDFNLMHDGFFDTLAGFGGVRFAITSQITNCCFIWDKGTNRIAHLQPNAGLTGPALRAGLAQRGGGWTLFGQGTNMGNGEYVDGEDVTIIGVNSGGWRIYAQVHTRANTDILRVVEL